MPAGLTVVLGPKVGGPTDVFTDGRVALGGSTGNDGGTKG